MKFSHTTVLQNEMVSHVLTNTNGTYVDCTLGGGGHSLALAEGLSNLGCIIGVDQDGEAIEAAKERLRGAQCKFISVRDSHTYDYVKNLYDGKMDRHLDPVLVGNLYKRKYNRVTGEWVGKWMPV